VSIAPWKAFPGITWLYQAKRPGESIARVFRLGEGFWIGSTNLIAILEKPIFGTYGVVLGPKMILEVSIGCSSERLNFARANAVFQVWLEVESRFSSLGL
jgi:hypothetical protein